MHVAQIEIEIRVTILTTKAHHYPATEIKN